MLSLLLCFILCSGCAYDRLNTKLRPTSADGEYAYFVYESYADLVYPEDSASAENTRKQWLEKWLEDNGMAGKPYEILNRKAVHKHTGLIGAIYDIYYDVRVKK